VGGEVDRRRSTKGKSEEQTMTSQRIVILGGAVGSLALMLYAGRSNTHVLITLLFIIWILGPFAFLAIADRRSASWTPERKAVLQSLTIVVTLASLAIYAYRAAVPPRSTGAFLFVIVPPVTVVLVLVALAISAVVSRPSR
jgi:membrane-bound metal-dependent hydrolase YbcI (DUF457 family)